MDHMTHIDHQNKCPTNNTGSTEYKSDLLNVLLMFLNLSIL